MPDIRFDQGDTGTVNRSRSDVTISVEVDVVALAVIGTAVFGLLDRPSGSAAVLAGAGSDRQITPDVAGTYRCRIVDDNDGSSVIHTFTVRTANRALAIPAFNERANPLVNAVDPVGDSVNESETNEGGLYNGWHPHIVELINEVEAIPTQREVFFSPQENTALGDYRTRSVGASGSFQYSFQVPADFGSLVELVAIMAPGATNAAADIDLVSQYGAEGESTTQHTEADTTGVYNLVTGVWAGIDVSPVFSVLAAGDRCGIQIDHNAIGATAQYLAIRMRYIQA